MHLLDYLIKSYWLPGLIIFVVCCTAPDQKTINQEIRSNFKAPPMSAHPGVYWYFMDGNMSKKEMKKDLESMKEAGISHLVFLEVFIGIPRGEVDFMSDRWLELFKFAEQEARKLDIAITLGIGPGWTGSGGPWVEGKSSMQHLVASEKTVKGPQKLKTELEVPAPHKPFFGENIFTEELKSQWKEYYEDVAVLAFPAPDKNTKIDALEKKSLVYRAPYTSDPSSKPYLPAPSTRQIPGVKKSEIVDLTGHLNEDGMLEWNVPEGEWNILRFVSRNNGSITRPAPLPGLGFESDKFDSTALKKHLDNYVGKIIEKIKPLNTGGKGGLQMLHMDSWEMGAQNWTQNFREKFRKSQGYDPLKYFPVYHGFIVENKEKSERFLWDLRMVSQELIFENHVQFVKKYAHKNGLGLSIEPYDMNPTADLALGSHADVPMAEFWTNTFNASYTVNEATSIAHVNGKSVVQAEAFTSGPEEKMLAHPASIKNQGDWAFASGINRFFYHTFVHKSLGDSLKPGMTMGPYGVHWDRGQTWWPMVKGYHTYISRASYMMQQGRSVADILYLTPEGVPQVFVPPPSALKGTERLPDRKGYDFDGCYPQQLMEKATVDNGKIVFPGGASYEVLVLPVKETMTLKLLNKIEQLINNGATVIGPPPERSPSLKGFPEIDIRIQQKAKKVWGNIEDTSNIESVTYEDGHIIFGGALHQKEGESLYPGYEQVAAILDDKGVIEDFSSPAKIRYGHRKTGNADVYFVSNTLDKPVTTESKFRVTNGVPQLWDPVNGEIYALPQYEKGAHSTSIPLKFEPHQSYFIVFSEEGQAPENARNRNFPEATAQKAIKGPWKVAFNTTWGGPKRITFDTLKDWRKSPDENIKYYSGIASYKNTFELPARFVKNSNHKHDVILNLNNVKNIARVTLNGKQIGVVWCPPWEIDITNGIREGENKLEIEVANLWANRLIGDEQYMDDGIRNGEWPDWLLKGEKRPSERYTFITHDYYDQDSPLQPSGLLGPVTIRLNER